MAKTIAIAALLVLVLASALAGIHQVFGGSRSGSATPVGAGGSGWGRIDKLILGIAGQGGYAAYPYYPPIQPYYYYPVGVKKAMPTSTATASEEYTGNYQVRGVAELDYSSFYNGKLYVVVGDRVNYYDLNENGSIVRRSSVSIGKLAYELAPNVTLIIKASGSSGSTTVKPVVTPRGVLANRDWVIVLATLSYNIPLVEEKGRVAFFPWKTLVLVFTPDLTLSTHHVVDGVAIDARLSDDTVVIVTRLPSYLPGAKPLVVHPCVDGRELSPQEVVIAGKPSSYTLVTAIDAASNTTASKAVLSNGTHTVMVLTRSGTLYLASPSLNGEDTLVLALNASPAEVVLLGNTTIRGRVTSQWQLQPYKEYLIVVASSGFNRSDEASLHVLDGGTLREIASISRLGLRESVYGVRLVGDILVFVTYHRIDPFYAVNLSDPSRPRVIGYLKGEGFDSYIHPLGGSLLLGVGVEGSSLRITLYNLSRGGLTILDRIYLPHTWSPVLSGGRGHLAFSYDPEHHIALIPVNGELRSDWYSRGIAVVSLSGGRLALRGFLYHECALRAYSYASIAVTVYYYATTSHYPSPVVGGAPWEGCPVVETWSLETLRMVSSSGG